MRLFARKYKQGELKSLAGSSKCIILYHCQGPNSLNTDPFILYLVVLPWCFWRKHLHQPDALIWEWRGDNSYVAILHLIQFVEHAFMNRDLLSENAHVFLVQCFAIPEATWAEWSGNQLNWNRCPGFSLCWILFVSKSHKIWHQLLSVR